MLGKTLLFFGMILPLISALTCIASAITRWRNGRYASPVLIPVIGPVLLTAWIIVDDVATWSIALVWLLDLGTIAFLLVLPRLAREWWRLSVFTQIMRLKGTQGIQNAIITLHTSGRYFLRKSWNRPPDEIGIVGLGETGSFAQTEDCIKLQSDHGLQRVLQHISNSSFVVEEPDVGRPDLEPYSLRGWHMNS